MNIHEHQAKSLLRKFGVLVPEGGVAYTVNQALEIAKSLPGPLWVVKSQIHAGGRSAGRFKNGKHGNGGVRIAKSIADVKEHAHAMLNQILITNIVARYLFGLSTRFLS